MDNTGNPKHNIAHYTKEQQVVLLILAALMFVIVALCIFLPKGFFVKAADFQPDAAMMDSIAKFEARLDSIDRADSIRNRRFPSKPRYDKAPLAEEYENFTFDPNTADSATLVLLGFKPWVARNIIKYRKAGGVIRNADGLKRIYGIDTARVEELRDFIVIQSEESPQDSIAIEKQQYVAKEYFAFDLNRADVDLLKKLPGIGAARAKSIIGYRYRLGGYSNALQLYEIEDMPDSIADVLQQYATVDIDSIKKIVINKAGVKSLRRHPYINYYQAKEIYEMRWDKAHKGRIEKADFMNLKTMKPEEVERLMPYLSFE